MATLKNASKTFKPGRAKKLKKTKSFVNKSRVEWWEKETKKKKGMRLCAHCGAVYYEGHWHTAPALSALLQKSGRPSGKGELCIQCRWVVEGAPAGGRPLFEGELTLDGLENLEEKAEILKTLRNAAARAFRRDPEDRIVSIDDRGGRVVISTSENQLAVALGKAVDAAYKGGKLTITWSYSDLPARVYWCRSKGKC